jgi:hypothetical protein
MANTTLPAMLHQGQADTMGSWGAHSLVLLFSPGRKEIPYTSVATSVISSLLGMFLDIHLPINLDTALCLLWLMRLEDQHFPVFPGKHGLSVSSDGMLPLLG